MAKVLIQSIFEAGKGLWIKNNSRTFTGCQCNLYVPFFTVIQNDSVPQHLLCPIRTAGIIGINHWFISSYIVFGIAQSPFVLEYKRLCASDHLGSAICMIMKLQFYPLWGIQNK